MRLPLKIMRRSAASGPPAPSPPAAPTPMVLPFSHQQPCSQKRVMARSILQMRHAHNASCPFFIHPPFSRVFMNGCFSRHIPTPFMAHEQRALFLHSLHEPLPFSLTRHAVQAAGQDIFPFGKPLIKSLFVLPPFFHRFGGATYMWLPEDSSEYMLREYMDQYIWIMFALRAFSCLACLQTPAL